MNVGVNSRAKERIGRECGGRRRKNKDRLKDRVQKKNVVTLSNICEIHYCVRCTALFFLKTYFQYDNHLIADIERKKNTQDLRSISSSL